MSSPAPRADSATTAPATSIKIAGQEYPLVWGALARVRYASLPKWISAAGEAHIAGIISLVWASIAIKPNPFDSWEDLAEIYKPEMKQSFMDALKVLFPAPTEEVAAKNGISESGPSLGSTSGFATVTPSTSSPTSVTEP